MSAKPWRIGRSPFCHLYAWHNGKEVGEACYAEPEPGARPRWWAETGKKVSGPLPNKREAVEWLLVNCPRGAAVNEISAHWELLPITRGARMTDEEYNGYVADCLNGHAAIYLPKKKKRGAR